MSDTIDKWSPFEWLAERGYKVIKFRKWAWAQELKESDCKAFQILLSHYGYQRLKPVKLCLFENKDGKPGEQLYNIGFRMEAK